MKISYITLFLVFLPLLSCDKSWDKQKEETEISDVQPSLAESAVPIRVNVDRHVSTVLLAASEESGVSLDELFKRQGIIFTYGASLKIADEGIVEGRLGKSQHDILKQCLRLMEKDGQKFTKDYFHEEDCSCF